MIIWPEVIERNLNLTRIKPISSRSRHESNQFDPKSTQTEPILIENILFSILSRSKLFTRL